MVVVASSSSLPHHHHRHNRQQPSPPVGESISSSSTKMIAMTPPHPNRLLPQQQQQQQQQSSSSSSFQKQPQQLHQHPSQPNVQTTTSIQLPPLELPALVHLTRISEPSHLSSLPPEFLSNSTHYNYKQRPLLHIDIIDLDNDDDNYDHHGHRRQQQQQQQEYTYYLNPMKHAVFYILAIEMLERFSFYGINYTTTAYLTGEYNDDWNANMPSILASSYVSISTAVAYTTPFLGALLADNLLGEYMTILLGSILCYIPGLTLIAFTTIPQFLGQTFNHSAIQWGLLILWPMGTGTVKACVNVFGAKQFHPILQSSFIESYYVNFYMCINIGALTGGIVVPLVAQRCVTLAYFIPVAMLGLGVLMFVVGTERYVRPQPIGCGGGSGGNSSKWQEVVRWMWKEKRERWCEWLGGLTRKNGTCTPLQTMTTIKKMTSSSSKQDRTAMNIQPSSAESKVGVGTIAILSGLVVPFNVAYAQMATTFIVQGSVMTNFGVVDAPMMNNADAVSVLAFGYIIGNIIYPALNRRGIKIPTTYKFAIGSAFGALAVGSAILTDYRIHRVYHESGEAITVLWQVFPYFLIGIGEIFAVSAAYELAFTVAPSKMKSVASAANLFMVGGLPNVVCIMLYNACRGWFLNKHGEAHIHKLKDYASAKVVNYFWLVELIALLGVVINVLPSVKNWVESIEETAAESINSPISTPIIRKKLLQKRKYHSQHSSSLSTAEEETPLVDAQKRAAYVKYSERPELRKFASFRAGPSSKSKQTGAVLPQYQHDPSHSPAAKDQFFSQVSNALSPHAVGASSRKSP